MAEKLDIQGHMKKALFRLDKIFAVVDGVIEVADARSPGLTKFGPLKTRLSPKLVHFLVLTHADTADPKACAKLVKDLHTPPNPAQVFLWHPRMNSAQLLKHMRPTTAKTRRWVVVGLPNVGKSHLINRLAGRHLPRGNKAGVTRSLTWVRAENEPFVEILDSPGLLPPKVSHSWHRSVLRVLKVVDEKPTAQDIERFLHLLWPDYSGPLQDWLGKRVDHPDDFLEIARLRFGQLKDEDYEKTATMVFKALDQGKIKFSLPLEPQFPEDSEDLSLPIPQEDPWQ